MFGSVNKVAKRAEEQMHMVRPTVGFPNARSAFKALLEYLQLGPNDDVLLPAYVGWSSREGSGVFDPIEQLGLGYRFYRMTKALTVDVQDFRSQITRKTPRVVLFIHYFGYPDPNLPKLAAISKQAGALVVEDEAHALYTDWVTGTCGRYGDFAIMSLHKMLPLDGGGLLVLNNQLTVNQSELTHWKSTCGLLCSPLDYDLVSIAKVRRQNAQLLIDLLKPLAGRVEPLFRTLPCGVIPQTLPVVLSGQLRDEVYFEMNDAGFGVVSLYHTLIDVIAQADYPASHWLARHILNLPVHQDVLPGQLKALISHLVTVME